MSVIFEDIEMPKACCFVDGEHSSFAHFEYCKFYNICKKRDTIKTNCKPSDCPVKALEQEPKTGHWILTDIEGYRVWHCNCSECGKDPQDYIGGSEDWWLIKNKLPKFCPNCGSDNREVEE